MGLTALCQRFNRYAMNAQLRRLNPLLTSPLRGMRALAPTQTLLEASVHSSADVTAGVSSFGYSGTIAHAVIRTRVDSNMSLAVRLCPRGTYHFSRHAFRWHTTAGSTSHAFYRAYWVPTLGQLAGAAAAIPRSSLLLCTEPLGSADVAISSSFKAEHHCVGRRPSEATAALASQSHVAVGLLVGSNGSPEPRLDGLHLLLELVQNALLLHSTVQVGLLLVLTSGSQTLWPVRRDEQLAGQSGPTYGGAWGLMRVARLEDPETRSVTIDLPHSTFAAKAATEASLKSGMANECELAWCGDMQNVSRLRHIPLPPPKSTSLALTGEAVVVTGGLGGLGLRAAKLAVVHGSRLVLVASRSASPRATAMLGAPASVALARSSDISRRLDVRALFCTATGAKKMRVLHAAGVLRDRLLQNMTFEDLDVLFSSKGIAAACIHGVVITAHLSSLILFSSVVSTFGNVGQGNYAAANSFLDALALFRRRQGVAACSLQLPAVRGAGMGASDTVSRQLAENAIPPSEYSDALRALLHSASFVLAAPVPHRLLAAMPPALSLLAELKSELVDHVGKIGRSPGATLDNSQLESRIQERLLMLTASEELSLDQPLTTAGLDSLGAADLAMHLQQLTSTIVPPTLPLRPDSTIRFLASHALTGQMMATTAQPEKLDRGMFDAAVCVATNARMPCSSLQYQLLLHHQIQPESTSYNEPIKLGFDVHLTESTACEALQALTSRHSILRTYFALDTDAAAFHQVVLPERGFNVPLTCCSDEASWETQLQRELHTPFDLFVTPPIRAILLQVTCSCLVINVHHVAADLTAMAIIQSELRLHCEALAHGRAAPVLPQLGCEYIDFVSFELTNSSSQGHSGHHESSLTWWVTQLEGAPAVLKLPADRPRPHVQETDGASVRACIASSLTQRILGLCVPLGVTLNSALLAVWSALLLHLSGQIEVIVGQPHSMR